VPWEAIKGDRRWDRRIYGIYAPVPSPLLPLDKQAAVVEFINPHVFFNTPQNDRFSRNSAGDQCHSFARVGHIDRASVCRTDARNSHAVMAQSRSLGSKPNVCPPVRLLVQQPERYVSKNLGIRRSDEFPVL
jgi:hypothetical protein